MGLLSARLFTLRAARLHDQQHPAGRFVIDVKNSAMASRIIRDTLEAGRIRCHDDTAGSKAKKYLPWWA